jgi:RNA polymerase sigma factor (sigma-70 family)
VSTPHLSSERTGTATAATEHVRWFTTEVHTHDSSLKSYLRGSFPALQDVEDIAQESYIRVWRYRATEPIRCVRAFLFKIAERLALDVVRRQRRSPLEAVGDLPALYVLDDGPTADESITRQEKIDLLVAAIDSLPARCRAVVIHRKLEFRSQRETAALLGISEKGVENQLARGLDRCREFLRRRGMKNFFGHES